MTKLRFYLNIVIILIFTAAGVVVSGNSFLLYLDLFTLILGLGVPFLVLSMIFPLSDQRRFYQAIFDKSIDDQVLLKKTVGFLKSWKRLIIYSAVIWSVTGAIGIGAHLEGPEALGLNFGVLMIVPLYTTLFLLIVIEPLRASAENKIV